MEINTLNDVGDTTTASATSVTASCVASPASVGLGLPVRTRSMSGVGARRVAASWLDDAKVVGLGCVGPVATILDSHDPQFSTRKFSTRQRPPTCSPPV